jgi:hypothetical protein
MAGITEQKYRCRTCGDENVGFDPVVIPATADAPAIVKCRKCGAPRSEWEAVDVPSLMKLGYAAGQKMGLNVP